MKLTQQETELIIEHRNLAHKKGDYWLTLEGRREIREAWSDPEDGNIVLPLLNALEKLESMRCETCRYHRFKEDTRSACDYLEIFVDDGDCCCHWEGRE